MRSHSSRAIHQYHLIYGYLGNYLDFSNRGKHLSKEYLQKARLAMCNHIVPPYRSNDVSDAFVERAQIKRGKCKTPFPIKMAKVNTYGFKPSLGSLDKTYHKILLLAAVPSSRNLGDFLSRRSRSSEILKFYFDLLPREQSPLCWLPKESE